jgi:hypothetical protein
MLSDSAFTTLKSLSNQATSATGLALSAFNFLNLMNYGLFYHVTTDSIATKTVLLSHWVLIIPSLTVANQFGTAYSTILTIPTTTYPITAQKLCYGSSDIGIVTKLLNIVSNSHEIKLCFMDSLVCNIFLLAIRFIS